ncbi:MAG: glycosyltransferase family 39 protein [Anaerolineae bacterium]
MSLLRRLLDPAYLYAIDPGPLGPWKWFYLVWGMALAAGTVGAWWGGRRARLPLDRDLREPGDPRTSSGGPRGRAFRRVATWAFAFGLGTLLLRILAPRISFVPQYARYLILDVWTARVWPLSATVLGLLALAGTALAPHHWPAIVKNQVKALTGELSPDDPPLPAWAQVVLGSVHLGGLGCLWILGGYAAWWAIPSLLALSLLPLAVRPRRIRLETLAPLLPAYLGAVASLLLERRLGIEISEYQGTTFPDPWSPWFNVPALAMAGAGYALWIQLRLLASRWRVAVRDRVVLTTVGLLLAAWFAGTVLVHRTHGVTASDPYSYTQMAIDLTETGSPLHAFPLAGIARSLDLPTWPAVHVGYHPPTSDVRSPTMWPIGWPLLMVPFYVLGGLPALYFAAPLLQALSLVVTWLAANEVLRGEARAERWAVATGTCLLVATSPEGTERMLVPMADAAAQHFTMLTLWLLLRARRARPAWHGLGAGVAFGMAYLIRHPQLPLGAAAVATAWFVPVGERNAAWRQRAALLLPFLGAALLVALPDLIYHRVVFGGWLHTESSEWFLISARNVGPSLASVLEQGVLRREELGYLVPFLGMGVWRLWRRQRAPLVILGSGAITVFAFHLAYEALRPRDLIAILPVAYLCAAAGILATWQWARRRQTLLAALCVLCSVVLLGVRSWYTLVMPWRDDVVTFGQISTRQRAALERLRSLTPEDAVIGSMLNGGAIELHAGRGAVHPAPWRKDELYVWVDALLAKGRPFYVLDDGEEMALVLRNLGERYRLRTVTTLELPYFALGGGNLPRPATLYSVQGDVQSP